jgi:hypothetical protein
MILILIAILTAKKMLKIAFSQIFFKKRQGSVFSPQKYKRLIINEYF